MIYSERRMDDMQNGNICESSGKAKKIMLDYTPYDISPDQRDDICIKGQRIPTYKLFALESELRSNQIKHIHTALLVQGIAIIAFAIALIIIF